MNCSWCHSPILEDARNINNELSVHYWCIDFLEPRLQVLYDRGLWRNLIQFLRSTSAAYFRRIRPQFIRYSPNADVPECAIPQPHVLRGVRRSVNAVG